jgi:alkaline phosphatase D
MAVMTETPVVGAMTPTSCKIAVRTDVQAQVAIEYADNKRFRKSTTTPSVQSDGADDFCVMMSLSGLNADDIYWYRVLVDGVEQVTGTVQKFLTFPATSQAFKFAVLADVSPNDKVAAAYGSAASDQPLFMMQIGDLDHRNPATLAEMRQMHRDMKDASLLHGGDLQELSSKKAMVHIWDDHDYGGDDTDKTFPGRSDAWKAFDEHWPTYDRPNPAAGLWHSFTCGDAEFFVLDTRSQRDPDIDPDGPDKSMLDGDNIPDGQLQWLKDGLLASAKTWKFIVSTVTFNPTARPASIDHWKSFATERDDIKSFIDANSITGVIALTGDIHTGGAIDDGTNSVMGPELSVPHTNLNIGNQSNLGTWSQGVTPGAKGYGMVTVSATSVTLETMSHLGVVQHTLTL